jgi:hypothetical protein
MPEYDSSGLRVVPDSVENAKLKTNELPRRNQNCSIIQSPDHSPSSFA